MAYNNIRILHPSRDMILDIPIFRGRVFEANTEDLLASPNDSRAFGSCAFEFASILKLLPGQSRTTLLETEPTSVHQLICDKETYYAKSSRHGLFQLITQHFVSLRESSGHIIIQTDIGIFTLIQTERRLLVRVNSEGKALSSAVLAPEGQDYVALQHCARGQWCQREGDHVLWVPEQRFIPGAVREWAGPIDTDSLLFKQNIEHHNCIYFLEAATFQELQFRMQCAFDLQDVLEWIYEQRSELFPYMAQSFKTCAALKNTPYVTKEDLRAHLFIVKLLIGDAMELESSPAEEGSPARENEPYERVSPADGSSAAQEKPSPATLLSRCLRLHGTLLRAYRVAPTQQTLQDILLSVLEEDHRLVGGQVPFAFLFRGNAQFLLHRAVSVPQILLDVLTAAEGEVYIG
jgi:hypothetical protein